jgi:hypothetical protein
VRQQNSAYDTAAACEQMRFEMLYTIGAVESSFPDSTNNKHARSLMALNRQRYLNAKRVATDDPRLKGN